MIAIIPVDKRKPIIFLVYFDILLNCRMRSLAARIYCLLRYLLFVIIGSILMGPSWNKTAVQDTIGNFLISQYPMVDIDHIFHGQLEIGSFPNPWHDGLISREACRCRIRLMW